MHPEAILSQLERRADRICVLILTSDYPEIDIRLEAEELREEFEHHFPDRMDLYSMIYESRFRRLWDQFRQEG